MKPCSTEAQAPAALQVSVGHRPQLALSGKIPQAGAAAPRAAGRGQPGPASRGVPASPPPRTEGHAPAPPPGAAKPAAVGLIIYI